ncbi:MAG: aconitate hydratase [Desulfovibrio sp.]|nr:MAG: aconitate hydratase [Desulfovibrio sp.]
MGKTLTHKIIADHLLSGDMTPGAEIGLRIDQTLTQDATGTMAYLQFEALGLDKVQTELSVSYVDHNTLQMGFRNPDDHRYLRTVAKKYGIIFSPPGTGICHQLHLENFAKPGKTLIGSDSHTPTAGGVGSLAIGAGGLSVALAMAGEPYPMTMPQVVRVYLEGRLGGWSAAKDVILHLLGELTVKGGVGKVFEFGGPGVETLTVPERATITNMGAELGATTSIFPSDEQTKTFLHAMYRDSDYIELLADEDAQYDDEIVVDLKKIQPLAAQPHMPDKVVPVSELAGLKVDQVCIGSCTNSSYSDLKAVAQILRDKMVHEETDLLIAPGSKQVLKMLSNEKLIEPLLDAGARILECTCGPCIGMGGSPTSGGVSARTFNRNFEGRSGTQDGQVYLVSPQTAANTAAAGEFTRPYDWGFAPTKPKMPPLAPQIGHLFVFPPTDGSDVEVERGPNIVPLEQFEPLPDVIETSIQLKTEDNVTTDHIMPAGAQITALRSNVPAISEYVFSRVDESFVSRIKDAGHGVILGGENYGQGSSREHAAIAPRHLGVRAVLVKSLARIHRANLVNFGILPFILADPADYDKLSQGQKVTIPAKDVTPGGAIAIDIEGAGQVQAVNDLTAQELDVIKAGGLLNYIRQQKA